MSLQEARYCKMHPVFRSASVATQGPAQAASVAPVIWIVLMVLIELLELPSDHSEQHLPPQQPTKTLWSSPLQAEQRTQPIAWTFLVAAYPSPTASPSLGVQCRLLSPQTATGHWTAQVRM